MKNLLKFELYKLFHSVSFYLIGALIIFSTASHVVDDKLTYLSYSKLQPDYFDASYLQNMANSDFASLISGTTLLFILAIFLTMFASSDFKDTTIKNVYARGFSKTKYYTAKVIVGLIATLIFLISAILVGYVFVLIFLGVPSSAGLKIILLDLIILIGFAMLFMFVALSLKKLFAVSFITNLIGPIGLYGILLGIYYTIFVFTDGKFKFEFSNYWLYGMFLNVSMIDTVELSQSYAICCIVGPIIYSLIFFVSGYFISKKNEV